MAPFDSVIGQPQAVELLTQAVTKQRVAPAYVFAGPDGVGRSVAALCFVELLFSQQKNLTNLRNRIHQRNHPDLLWVAPTYLHQGKRFTIAEALEAGIKRKSSPVIRLEQIREISQFLGRSPLEAPRSVVVVESAEAMAESPANALLKTLEEPGQATVILIAQSVDSLLPTLVSRCQRIPFKRLSTDHLIQVLQAHASTEILENPKILQLAQGSPGSAITHWQQLQTIPAELMQAISQPPRSHREALTLAKQIGQIEVESQLWLIDYLQQRYWDSCAQTVHPSGSATILPITLLEKARDYLSGNVNARLVWEVTLMQMVA